MRTPAASPVPWATPSWSRPPSTGRTPTGGRIVAAVGRSGARVDPARVRLVLCGIERFRDGRPVNGDRKPSSPSCSRPPTSRWRSIWAWATAATTCAPRTSATNTSASTPITARKRGRSLPRGEGRPFASAQRASFPSNSPSSPNALYQGGRRNTASPCFPASPFCRGNSNSWGHSCRPSQASSPAKQACRTGDPPVMPGSSLSGSPASDILTFSHLLPLC